MKAFHLSAHSTYATSSGAGKHTNVVESSASNGTRTRLCLGVWRESNTFPAFGTRQTSYFSTRWKPTWTVLLRIKSNRNGFYIPTDLGTFFKLLLPAVTENDIGKIRITNGLPRTRLLRLRVLVLEPLYVLLHGSYSFRETIVGNLLSKFKFVIIIISFGNIIKFIKGYKSSFRQNLLYKQTEYLKH